MPGDNLRKTNRSGPFQKKAAFRHRRNVVLECPPPVWIPRPASKIAGGTPVKYRKLLLTGKSTRILVLLVILAALSSHSLHAKGISQAKTETLVVLDTPALTVAATPKSTSAGERAALVALYRTTDGVNWKRSDNWLTELPVSTWYGVYTDASGRVIDLSLSDNGLHGPLPDLSPLTSLEVLGLSHNRLTGPIPDLSALTNLKTLSLHSNQLAGPIPDLSALIGLEWLTLSYNRLIGPVPDLKALTKLTTLDLAVNQLCLPERLSSPGSNAVVTAHLKSLDLPSCTSAGAEERAALAALYTTTDGANWKRSDNWLTELPVSTWYGVSTDGSGRVTELLLPRNGLHGPFPDLSALTSLTKLYLASNRLTGQISEMDALTGLEWLSLSRNQLTGPIPDLSLLTNLTMLNLSRNRLTGPVPDLSSLTGLEKLYLDHNRLTGPVPDLSFLTNLEKLYLDHNRLTGPILDLNLLTRLKALNLSDNRLTGPAPDLSGFTHLTSMRLTDNQLCLSPGFAPSGLNPRGAVHLKKLDLATCTDVELQAVPAAPANLTPNIGVGQVTLTWDRVANAAAYDLRVWDSLQRRWGPVDGVLTGTSFTHSGLTGGRNYYYQVRSRDAKGVRSAWSERVYAAVVPPLFPPPPESLGLDTFYQKYFDAGGVVVVAPSEVSDEKMVQAQEIITGLLSHLPGLLELLVSNRARIAIFKYKEGVGGLNQLPEFRDALQETGGMASRSPTGWVAAVPEDDYFCGIFIHEFAHLVHYAVEGKSNLHEYNSRLVGAYHAAMDAGLWQGAYASTNAYEYFAEIVVFWLRNSSRLEDYDPEAARLVKELFGEATVPWYCKP